MRIPGLLAALLLLALPASPALGETKSYEVHGQVTEITPGAVDPTSSLASLGVHVSSTATLDYTVDLSTPVGLAGTPTVYFGPVTSLTLTIGSWSATGVDLSSDMDNITVANSTIDLLVVSTRTTDTNLLLKQSDIGLETVALSLSDGDGHSIDDQSLDQDPAAFPSGSIAVSGPNGTIHIMVTPGGGSPSGDASAKCRGAQLSAAAKMCQASFKCLAKHAKAPDKDPENAVVEACRGKADTAFLGAFSKALMAAERKGLSCGTQDSAITALEDLDGAISDQNDEAAAITPPNSTVISGWLTAAGTACSAGLRAEASNAAKPSEPKRAAARAKARAKLDASDQMLVDKAVSKGVTFDPAPDVTGFGDDLDHRIDATAAELNGD